MEPDGPESTRVRRMVRHDLRSPLAVILGRCELLVDPGLGPLTSAQKRSVEVIRRQADRLVSMLDELADLV